MSHKDRTAGKIRHAEAAVFRKKSANPAHWLGFSHNNVELPDPAYKICIF